MIKKQKHLKICFVNIYISMVLLITNPSILKKRIIGRVKINIIKPRLNLFPSLSH